MSISLNIIRIIDAFLKNSTKNYYGDFYIGITNNIERRLFGEHNVTKNSPYYVCCCAENESDARSVETYYLEKGMKGGDGGGNGDGSTIYVYCYEITGFTKQ